MIKKRLIALLFLVFGLGWIAHLLTSQFAGAAIQTPMNVVESIFPAKEQASPYDWIKQDQIHISDDNVSIDIQNPQWAIFTNTNSMDPVIDETSHAIEIIPQTKEDVHVGDIVSYELEGFEGILIHRIVEIGEDKDGWYALAKGDNNTIIDPDKIRFNQVQRILVAIIY